ncbi:PQQ-binding-like beta-propeller repeat protein [Rhodococcus sp. NPDC047139]|uniref:outer membrane protein assembly factor BamB family protein n=1 Tax=Rhodococcus sp. NPDC047139 TaxID=3155141 RepID=UPI0033C99AD2
MRTSFKAGVAVAAAVAIGGTVAVGVAAKTDSDRDATGGPSPALGTYAQAPVKAWDTTLLGDWPAIIVINDSHIVFGSENNGAGQATLVGMDLATGTELWSKELPPSDCGSGSDVAYTQGSTIVACFDFKTGTISTFDIATGDALGAIDARGTLEVERRNLPSVYVQGDSLAVCERTSMSAVLRYGRAADFDSGWKLEIPANSPNGCIATVAGSWVAAEGPSHYKDTHKPWFVVADLNGSTLFESFETSGNLTADGRLTTETDPDYYFAGYDILDTTGKRLGSTGEIGKFFSHPTEETVFPYYVNSDGDVYRTEGNSLLWVYDEAEEYSTIMPAANNLIFVEEKVRLSAYDVETGERQWSRALDQLVDPKTPKFDVEDLFQRGFNGYSDGKFLIGSTDTEIVAIDAESGDSAWSLPVQGGISERYGSYVFTRRAVEEDNEEFPGSIFDVYRFESVN